MVVAWFCTLSISIYSKSKQTIHFSDIFKLFETIPFRRRCLWNGSFDFAQIQTGFKFDNCENKNKIPACVRHLWKNVACTVIFFKGVKSIPSHGSIIGMQGLKLRYKSRELVVFCPKLWRGNWIFFEFIGGKF